MTGPVEALVVRMSNCNANLSCFVQFTTAAKFVAVAVIQRTSDKLTSVIGSYWISPAPNAGAARSPMSPSSDRIFFIFFDSFLWLFCLGGGQGERGKRACSPDLGARPSVPAIATLQI